MNSKKISKDSIRNCQLKVNGTLYLGTAHPLLEKINYNDDSVNIIVSKAKG